MRPCLVPVFAHLLAHATGAAAAAAAAVRHDADLPARDARFHRQKIMYDTVSMPPKSRQTMSHNPLDELKRIDPPCSDCFITYMEAHLEYEDKTRADLDTGVNLHHVVLVNMAEQDQLCAGAGWKQRFFWSGNERTPYDFVGDLGGEIQYGYYLNSSQEGLVLVEEFMNELEESQRVVFGMTWEYTNDTTLMSSMRPVHPHWLDVAPSCGNSQVPMENNTQFDYTGPSYTIGVEGSVVLAYGHAHEGATKGYLAKNGADLCEFTFDYTVEGSSRGGDHVKPVKPCVKPGRVSEEDTITISVTYDTEKYPVRMATNDGMLDSAMGLSLLFVAPGPEEHEADQTSLVPTEPTPDSTTQPSRLPQWSTVLYMIAGLEAVAAACLVWWTRRLRRQSRRARAFNTGGTGASVDEQDEQKSHLLHDAQSHA